MANQPKLKPAETTQQPVAESKEDKGARFSRSRPRGASYSPGRDAERGEL